MRFRIVMGSLGVPPGLQPIHLTVLTGIFGMFAFVLTLAQRLGDWKSKTVAKILTIPALILGGLWIYFLSFWVFRFDLRQVFTTRSVVWIAIGVAFLIAALLVRPKAKDVLLDVTEEPYIVSPTGLSGDDYLVIPNVLMTNLRDRPASIKLEAKAARQELEVVNIPIDQWRKLQELNRVSGQPQLTFPLNLGPHEGKGGYVAFRPSGRYVKQMEINSAISVGTGLTGMFSDAVNADLWIFDVIVVGRSKQRQKIVMQGLTRHVIRNSSTGAHAAERKEVALIFEEFCQRESTHGFPAPFGVQHLSVVRVRNNRLASAMTIHNVRAHVEYSHKGVPVFVVDKATWWEGRPAKGRRSTTVDLKPNESKSFSVFMEADGGLMKPQSAMDRDESCNDLDLGRWLAKITVTADFCDAIHGEIEFTVFQETGKAGLSVGCQPPLGATRLPIESNP
jgi:hypothetical protein